MEKKHTPVNCVYERNNVLSFSIEVGWTRARHTFHTFRTGGWPIKGEVRWLIVISTVDRVEDRRKDVFLFDVRAHLY